MDRLIDAKWLAQTFLAKKIIVIYDSEPAASWQSLSFFVLRWILDGVSRFPAISFLIKSQQWFQTPPHNFHDRLGLFEHSM